MLHRSRQPRNRAAEKVKCWDISGRLAEYSYWEQAMEQKNHDQKSAPDQRELDDDENNFPEFIEVTDVLDLHGFFPEQVPEIVNDFIQNALELKLYRLRIIHGKGKSRLKWEVHQVLKAHPQVAWFGDAPPEIGGWGATIVELKKPSHG